MFARWILTMLVGLATSWVALAVVASGSQGHSKGKLTTRLSMSSTFGSLLSQKTKESQDKYDYIIIGGGSAGCVLANRLSAQENKKVLLIEAGSNNYNQKYMKIPAGVFRLFKTKYDWDFNAVKEKSVNNREIYLCRGKVLGGSSSLNVLLYHRGNSEDYEHWAKATGCEAWGPLQVLPYFKKSEDDFRGASRYHGVGGEFAVSDVRYQNPLSRAFLAACQEFKFQINADFNDWSHSQEGVGRYQVNERNGARCSAATAFLQPALRRKNLRVISSALVHRILFDEHKAAVGVEMSINGEVHQLNLNTLQNPASEVILTAGAINSPQILMLSGIGPAAHLQAHGIPLVVDSPEVGQNLQDHPAAVVSYAVKPQFDGISPTSKLRIKNTTWLNPLVFLQWFLTRSGVLTSTGCDHGGFFKTQPTLTSPDLQMRFLAAKALSADGMATFTTFRNVPGNNDGISFQSIAVRPHSKGSVQLASGYPADKPCIQTGYFQDERDLVTLREGLKLSRKLAQASVFQEYLAEEVFPGKAVQTDADLDNYIRESVHTSNALVGTCRMGSDAAAVVSAVDLRVKGVQRLRIADASVMPKIVGGQTGAATVMIAERAADLLLGQARPVPV